MTPLLFILLSVAGGVGAVGRMVVDGTVSMRVERARRARGRSTVEDARWALPWGTILINIGGSLLLGIVLGLASARLLSEDAALVIGTGFLGGYTTFSTASYGTIRLLQRGGSAVLGSLLNGLGVLVVGTAAAGLGFWIGAGF